MATQTIAQMFDLKGKGAIVTGGAMGIGQAIAFRLAEAGASVMIADINRKAADQTLNQIKASGGKAKVIYADVSSETDVKKVIKSTLEAFGSLDILVNNAGIYPASPALSITEEMWDKVLDTNLKGVFLFSKAAAQEMIKAGHGGKIINLASAASLHPTGVMPHYDTSKAGLMMLTRSLAFDLGPHNILVNAVAPGTVRTPGQIHEIERGFVQALDAVQSAGQTQGDKPSPIEEAIEGLYQGMAAKLPLRRVGEPDDIAKVVLFLASSASNYMNGSFVLVDGGQLVMSVFG